MIKTNLKYNSNLKPELILLINFKLGLKFESLALTLSLLAIWSSQPGVQWLQFTITIG